MLQNTINDLLCRHHILEIRLPPRTPHVCLCSVQAYWSLQRSADLIEYGLNQALDIKKTELHNSPLSKFQHGNELSKPVCLWHGFLFFFAQYFLLCSTYLADQLQTSPESQTY